MFLFLCISLSITCVACLTFGIFIYNKATKSSVNKSFLKLCSAVCIWSLGYILMLNSAEIHTANIFRILSAVGWCFICSIWIEFSIALKSNGCKEPIKPLYKFLTYLPGILFLINNILTPAELNVNIAKTYYGWIDLYPSTVLTRFFFFSYFIIYISCGIYLVYDYGKKSNKKRVKKQSKIIMAAVSISSLCWFILDFFLEIYDPLIFPSAILFMSFVMLSILYATIKYNMMVLTPELVSNYIYKAVNDPIFFLDENLFILECNSAACTLLKLMPYEILNTNFLKYVEGNNVHISEILGLKYVHNIESNLIASDGSPVSFNISGSVVNDEFDDVLGIIFILHDITERKEVERLLKSYNTELEDRINQRTLELKRSNDILLQEIKDREAAEIKIKNLIYYDALTGLPNRRLFNKEAKRSLQELSIKGGSCAIMFVDFDNLKLINDTFGHKKGDTLLIHYSSRMQKVMRSNDILARIGGDEFLVLLSDLQSPNDYPTIYTVAENIMSVFKEPFYINDKENFVTVSIGTAVYPQDGTDRETLVRNADLAMYEVKSTGKNGMKLCSQEIKNKFIEKTKHRNSLYRALEKNELSIYYQPKINIKSGFITGFEALLRWKYHNEYFVSPCEFIPIAEETGLIVPIGYWVLENVFKTLKELHDEGLSELNMAVNLSANQLIQKDFTQRVFEIAEKYKILPQYIEFEITERITIKGKADSVKALHRLKELGFKISIDDFGTDYSSFMNLKSLPVDKLKIAMEFVQEMEKSPLDIAIVRSIINLAHSLQMSVIAEGVEAGTSLEILKNESCDDVQGFFFSKPLPMDELKQSFDFKSSLYK